MKNALILLAVALTLVGCDQVTTSNTGKTPEAPTPSVHGSVVLTVTSGSLPAGAQVRVAITDNSPKTLATPRAASTVPTGDFHKDIPVPAAGTVGYTVTGVPDGNYTIAVTLIDSNSFALGLTSSLNIEVAGGACAVPTFALSYPPVAVD